MATTSKNRNRFFSLPILSLILFCFIFLFTRTPNLFTYTDLISQTRPSEFHNDSKKPFSPASNLDRTVDDSKQPVSPASNLDRKGTLSSGSPEIEETVKKPSKSDLDVEMPSGPSSEIQETVEEPSSSDLDDEMPSGPSLEIQETVEEPSRSDLDDENKVHLEEKTVFLVPPESDFRGGLGGVSGGVATLSNETTKVPISLESGGDGVGRGEALLGVESGGVVVDEEIVGKLRNCDVYKGMWVRDEGYPIYKPGECPYVDEAFDCQNNGRPDSEYLSWRWKPDQCDLPRFNAKDFLMRLRGKRLMLVGDSMNRNQFESLLCLLREALPDKSRMYEVHGYKITKGRGFYIFKFEDYNCTVEFLRSHFLVREGVRVNAQGNSNPTLSIDRIDKTARRWQSADILVFNTGHWWTHGKTSRGKNYYKEGDYVYPRFDAVEAYRRAIKTWATWIKKNIEKEKLVFYRGYSSAHFRGGDWDSGGTCNGEKEPVVKGAILDSYPQKMTILEEVVKEVQVPILLLNVTRLTNYRKDGHPSVYGKNVTGLKKVSTRRQDCSHWCLPGVPDAWNELIYTTLVARQAR